MITTILKRQSRESTPHGPHLLVKHSPHGPQRPHLLVKHSPHPHLKTKKVKVATAVDTAVATAVATGVATAVATELR
jgi:hypothetical protein